MLYWITLSAISINDNISLLVKVVAVGVVGGSDLSKISEQLGKSGMYENLTLKQFLYHEFKTQSVL